MQCKDFETRVNQLLDRRHRPESDDRLLAHAQGCESCREALSASEFLFDGIDLLETPELSPGFARRVVAGALANPGPARRASAFPATRWLALSGAAAAVVLALVSAPFVFSLGGKLAQDRTAVPPPTVVKSLPARPASPARPQSGLALTTDYRDMFEQFPNNLPEAQRDALETVEQIPGGLRPITTSFGVAVGLIRNTLPRMKDETPPRKPQAVFPLGEWTERVT